MTQKLSMEIIKVFLNSRSQKLDYSFEDLQSNYEGDAEYKWKIHCYSLRYFSCTKEFQFVCVGGWILNFRGQDIFHSQDMNGL